MLGGVGIHVELVKSSGRPQCAVSADQRVLLLRAALGNSLSVGKREKCVSLTV